MTIGEKLRALRLERSMTQAELAGDHMTRNMLSAIEHGTSLPSYATLAYLSEKLNIDPSYFFDCGLTYEEYSFRKTLSEIKAEYCLGNYPHCVRLAQPFLMQADDEFAFILSDCYYHIGLEKYNNGDFVEAKRYFGECIEFSKKTVYPVYSVRRSVFYLQVIDALDDDLRYIPSSFVAAVSDEDRFFDFVVYSFLISLIDHHQSEKATVIYDIVRIRDEFYSAHFNARLAASLSNYQRAKELLWSIVNSDKPMANPFRYSVYEDLERYCKATDDYEGAYRCALAKLQYKYK